MGDREQPDEHDWTVITCLGYAVARAQLFEHAMVKLLEVQRHDMAIPLDERWPEIRKWLRASAGRTSGKLDVPEPISKDLLAVVECRNVVAHHAYRTYLTARENRGDRAVDEWLSWFDEQSKKLGRAYNGVMSIVFALRDEALDDEGLVEVWRKWIPEPVGPALVPTISQA